MWSCTSGWQKRSRRRPSLVCLCLLILCFVCCHLHLATAEDIQNIVDNVEEDTGFVPPKQYEKLEEEEDPIAVEEVEDGENNRSKSSSDFTPQDKYKEIPDWNSMEDTNVFELNANLDAFAHLNKYEALPATVLRSARDGDEDQLDNTAGSSNSNEPNASVPGFGFDYTITWIEHFEKKDTFLQMMNLAFVHGLMDNFQENVFDTLYDLKQPFIVPFQLQCTTEIYYLEDFNGLLNYLRFARLFQSTDYHRHWYGYQQQEHLKHDPHWDPFDNMKHERLFDTMERMEDEIKILIGIESRLVEMARKQTMPQANSTKEDINARKCTLTYLAVIRDLRNALVDLLQHINPLADLFCLHTKIHLNHQHDEEDEEDEDEDEEHDEAKAIERRAKQAKLHAKIARHLIKGHDLLWRTVSKHLSKTRYLEVEPVGYEFMTQLYIRDSLIHYFHENTICNERQELQHRNVSEVIVNIASEYEVIGEQRQAQIVVTNRIVFSQIQLDQCITYISTILDVNRDKLDELVQYCAVLHRSIYLYDATNDHELFDENLSEEEHAAAMEAYHQNQIDELLQDYRGKRAMMSKAMACLVFFDHHVDEEDAEICVPYDDVMTLPNRAAVMHAAALSSEVFEAGQQYPEPFVIQNPDYVFKQHMIPPFGEANMGNESHQSTNDSINTQTEPPFDEFGNPLLINFVSLLSGRALILGLGGEMHSYLLAHFPYLVVDSVEINVDVVRTAWEELGFSTFVCEIQQYQSRTKSLDTVTSYFSDAKSRKHRLEKILLSQKHRVEVLPHQYYLYEELYKHELHNQRGSVDEDEDEEEEEDEDSDAEKVEEGKDVHINPEEAAEAAEAAIAEMVHTKSPGEEVHVSDAEELSPPVGRRRLTEVTSEDTETQEALEYTNSIPKDQRSSPFQDETENLDIDTEDDEEEEEEDEEYRCRSNIIIADAWNYVEFIYMKVAEQENEVKEDLEEMKYPPSKISIEVFQKVEYYDYAFIDTLDEFWIHWPAKPYQQLAMSHVDRLASSFIMLKSILRPFTGTAVIRVSRDIAYQFLYQKLVSVFRSTQVVVVELSTTEALFIATRDRFMEDIGNIEELICEKVMNEDGEEVEKCRPRTSTEMKHEEEDEEDVIPLDESNETYPYRSITAEKLMKRSDRYRSIPHPCDDESDIAHDMGYLGLDLGFSYLTSLGFLTGVNCRPMDFVPAVDLDKEKRNLEEGIEEGDDEHVELTSLNSFFDADDEVQQRFMENIMTSSAEELSNSVDPLQQRVKNEDEDQIDHRGFEKEEALNEEEDEDDEDEEEEEEGEEENIDEYGEDAYIDLPEGFSFDL